MESQKAIGFFTTQSKHIITLGFLITFIVSPIKPRNAPLLSVYRIHHPYIAVPGPTVLIVENLEFTQAIYSLALYDADGIAVFTSGTGDLTPGIPKVINIQDIPGLPAGNFSLILSADRQVQSLVMIQPDDINGDNLDFYHGGTLPMRSSLLSPIYKGANESYSSIHIQNASAGPIDATVHFYNIAGQVVSQASISALPANATGTIRTNELENIPEGYTGWAEVTASGNIYPVVENSSTQTYEFVEPKEIPTPSQENSFILALRVALPRLFKAYDEGGGPRTSRVLLVNPTESEAQFLIKYTNSANESTYSPVGTLSAKEMLLINLADVTSLDNEEIYSAEVSSDSRIEVSEVTNYDSGIALPVGAYGYGYYEPRIDQHLPRVVLKDDRFSIFSILNTGWITATGSIVYNRLDGSSPGQTDFSIPVGGFIRLKTPDISVLGADFEGGAFITSSQPIAVEVDEFGYKLGTIKDIGFRPVPDGYSFSNSDSDWGSYPSTAYDYQKNDLIHMFGQDNVCWMVGSVCIVKPTAYLWHRQANRAMNDGRCDGFSTTSLRFFKSLDKPSDFQSGANTTHELGLSYSRRHISYYWVLQLPDPVARAQNEALKNTPYQVLNQLVAGMSSGAADPTSLYIQNLAKTSAHVITPYAIENRGYGVYWVHVYDNNHPDDANRHVTINANTNIWSYDLGGIIWAGDANSYSMGAIPISVYSQQPECPWCDGAGMQSGMQPKQSQIWLHGQGHLLITDSQGRKLGFVGDQFVDEIPGAFSTILPGGLGIPVEPNYYLPITDTYKILLDGQTLTQTESASLTRFGPGYAVSVDNVTVNPSTRNLIDISSNGTEVAYYVNLPQEPTLILAMDNQAASYQFEIQNVDLASSQVVTMTANTSNGDLILNGSKLSAGIYSLGISTVSVVGKNNFYHTSIPLLASDTHIIKYGDWDGSDTLLLEIDHGSNGSIDEVIHLENQGNSVYLPYISRLK